MCSLLIVIALLALGSGRALACAACFGRSDSALAEGMNMGILSLLGVIGLVLAGVASFFVFLARRSSRAVVHAADQPEPLSQTVNQS
jgi:hypothetical protein